MVKAWRVVVNFIDFLSRSRERYGTSHPCSSLPPFGVDHKILSHQLQTDGVLLFELSCTRIALLRITTEPPERSDTGLPSSAQCTISLNRKNLEGIWPEKRRYEYHGRSPSIQKIDQLLRVSDWMADIHSTFQSIWPKDENDGRRAFLLISTIGFVYEWKKGALDWE